MPSDTWTTESLFMALTGTDAVTTGAIEVELVHGTSDSLAATMTNFGDLSIIMSVGTEQILAQVLLWPVDSLKDPAGFAEMALRTHKLMPLSTFGIAKGPDGIDYYELFGAMSASSKLDDVVLELETLADNAIEAVQAYADDRK
jgi:uncharacterized protein YjfI (DUF2170 family)